MPEQSGGAGERRDQPTDLGSAPYPHRSPIGAALDKGNRSIGPLTPPPSSNLHHCPRTAEVRGSSPRRSRAPCGRPHGGPLLFSQGLAAPHRPGRAGLGSPRLGGEPPGILAGCRLRAESRRRRSTTIRFQRIASQHHPCAVAPSGCHSTREHGASGSLARKPWSKRGHRGCAGLPSHGGLAAQWRMDPSCGPDGETDEPPSPALPGWREDLGAAPIPRYGARGFQGAEGPASAAAIGGRRRGRRRPPADPIPPPPTGVARPPRAGGAAPGPRCRPPPPLKPPIWGTVGA